MTRRMLPAVLLVAASVTLPVASVSAQSISGLPDSKKDTAAAPLAPKERFNEGVELAGQKKYEEAIAIWLEVLDELDQEYLPKAHKALGLAYKKLGRLPQAWHHLTAYLESSGKNDTAAGAWFEEVEKELAQGHVKVTLSCEPAGALLTIGGSDSRSRSPYSCPLTWWFLPGKHQVRAEAQGFATRSEELDVRERGDSGRREIILARTEPERPIPTPGEGSPEVATGGVSVVKSAEPGEPQSRTLEWALIGSGLALGVIGGIVQGVGYSNNEDLYAKYNNGERFPDGDEGQHLYDAAYGKEIRPMKVSAGILFGVGGAAAVTGAVLWLVRDPARRTADGGPLLVVPVGLPGGGGALMTLEW